MRTPCAPLLALACCLPLACGDDDSTPADPAGSTSTTELATTTGPPVVDTTGEPDPTADDTGPDTTTGTPDTTTGPADESSSGGEDPLTFAGEMNGYRWELPCENPKLTDTCPWDPALLEGAIDDPAVTLHRETVLTFGGDPAVVYDVEIQIRGLSEPKTFTGGEVLEDHFQIGGEAGANDYNIYGIEVDDPAESYTLNRNEMGVGHYLFVLDYTVTIPIRGGSEVRLSMIDPNNIAIANPGGASGMAEPFVVPDIPPFPDPFFGQFIQMDVLSVTEGG